MSVYLSIVRMVMEVIFGVFASVGALLAALGAFIQLGLDLGERLSYMRRVRDLDGKGVEEAKEVTALMAYKRPEKLGWIPKVTHDWLQKRAPNMLGWSAVGLGAILLFISSLEPLASLSTLGTLVWILLFLIFVALLILVEAIVCAGGARRGCLRAETEWQTANPGVPLPNDPEKRWNEWFEKCHDKLFLRT